MLVTHLLFSFDIEHVSGYNNGPKAIHKYQMLRNMINLVIISIKVDQGDRILKACVVLLHIDKGSSNVGLLLDI